FGLAVVVIVVIQQFLGRTRTGRMMRAASDDPEAATLVGADARHVYGVATAIAFATVALAGLMFAMRSSFDPSMGPTRLIFAFEAVVIGGPRSLWGTLVGPLGRRHRAGPRAARRRPDRPGVPAARRPHRLPRRARLPAPGPHPGPETRMTAVAIPARRLA